MGELLSQEPRYSAFEAVDDLGDRTGRVRFNEQVHVFGHPLHPVHEEPVLSRRFVDQLLHQQGAPVPAALGSSDAMMMFDAFRRALYERGYVEGKNIVIEVRAADSKVERFPTLATELVELGVDLIVATNSLSARA